MFVKFFSKYDFFMKNGQKWPKVEKNNFFGDKN